MAKLVTYDQVPLCPSISLARALRTLQQHETLCDLTLIADDHKRVHVHRAVFAAMSGYIQKRLKNKQPCDSFILTGITVEGIRSLTEFVYGNVYAIHCNNVEEVYPLAMLFELHLLCKVAEYIDPEVKNMEWSNKIIPVSPNLLSRKPSKPLQVRKQVEENNNGTPGKIEGQNTDEDAGQSAKRKRTATNPTPKAQQAKRVRKGDEDENGKIEKAEEENPKLKVDNNIKTTKDENTDALKKYKRESSDAIRKPVITQELKIRLKRIDREIKCEPSKNKSISAVPEASSPVKSDDEPEAQEPDVIFSLEDSIDKKDTSPTKEKKTAARQESREKKETSTNEKEKTMKEQNEKSPCKEKKRMSTNEKDTTTKQHEERSPCKEKKETSTNEKDTAVAHQGERSPCKKTKETSTDEKETTTTTDDEKSPRKEKKETSTSKRKPKQPEETVFECGRCKVIFTSLEKCNEHMAKSHNVAMVAVNQNFICSKENCGFKCSDAVTLKDHVLVKHPQALVKKHKCGICDAEFGGVEALETHVSTVHSKRGNNEKEKQLPVINGKDHNDEPVLDRTTGELKVTNRPGPQSEGSTPDRTNSESKLTNRPGPKSAKLKQTKLIPDSPKSDSTPKRTETKVVNGQKIKVTYVDDRVIRVEDDSLLHGWAKLLVARKDLSKYDLYIQSPDNKRHRSMTDLHKYLDSKQIEMETDHISFSQAQLLEETGIPPPPGAKGTPRRRSNKPGPKSSKKFKERETSDEEMEVDETSFDESEKKVNGNISDDEDAMDHEEACDKDSDESKEQEQCEKNLNSHVLQVDVHAY